MTSGRVFIYDPRDDTKTEVFRLSHDAYPDGGLGDWLRDFLASAPSADSAKDLADQLEAYVAGINNWGGFERGDLKTYGEWVYTVAQGSQGWTLISVRQGQELPPADTSWGERNLAWIENTVNKSPAELQAPALPPREHHGHHAHQAPRPSRFGDARPSLDTIDAFGLGGAADPIPYTPQWARIGYSEVRAQHEMLLVDQDGRPHVLVKADAAAPWQEIEPTGELDDYAPFPDLDL